MKTTEELQADVIARQAEEIQSLKANVLYQNELLSEVFVYVDRSGADVPRDHFISEIKDIIEDGQSNTKDKSQFIIDELSDLRCEVDRLQTLTSALINRINNPEINNFIEGVQIEAAHRVERWGEDHDAHKTFEQWTALLVRLLGKFVDSNWSHDGDKALHHLITIAAVCANAHKQMMFQRERQTAMASHAKGDLTSAYPPDP